MTDELREALRRLLGPVDNTSTGPSVWTYPFWPAHDVAYDEGDMDDCD